MKIIPITLLLILCGCSQKNKLSSKLIQPGASALPKDTISLESSNTIEFIVSTLCPSNNTCSSDDTDADDIYDFADFDQNSNLSDSDGDGIVDLADIDNNPGFTDDNGNGIIDELEDYIASPDGPAPMIIVLRVDDGDSFTLPLKDGFNYDATIDWGDGSSSTIDSWNHPDLTHVFSAAGDYTLTINGTLESFGDGDYYQDQNKGLILKIEQLGKLGWKDLSYSFAGLSKLESFNSGITDTSLVSDMSYMFAKSLAVAVDLSTINTSSVTHLTGMFQESYVLELDLSTFDTTSLQNIDQIFLVAWQLQSVNMSNWDVSHMSTPQWGWDSFGYINPSQIICNDPDNGGNGAPGTGTIFGKQCI
jgi:hypothetical protein